MPFIETSAKATRNVDMAFDTMTKEIKEKMMNKPGAGGSRSVVGFGQNFSHGRAIPSVTPGGEPSVEQLNSVNLNKKKERNGKGGCC